MEIDAKVVMKGTHSGTQGIYSDDPRTNPDAELLTNLTHLEVLDKGLKVMDSTAIALCMDNAMPIVVFDLLTKGNAKLLLEGATIGTFVGEKAVTHE